MSTTKLLFAEIRHRKTNFALSLIAVVCAATLFVTSPTLLEGYKLESQAELDAIRQNTADKLARLREDTTTTLEQMEQKQQDDLKKLDKSTKRTMRDLGFNLRIVHKKTDFAQLYANFQAFDMPEEYIHRLANAPEITKIVHLVATLRQMIQWNGQPRLLVGMAPEATQSHIEKKAPMGIRVEPGTVVLGYEAGKDYDEGDSVEVLGKRFTVARVLDQHGRREEDIAIVLDLKDAQEVLEKPNKISEIVALGCKCRTVERIEEIREQLEGVLPEAKVTELKLQAMARDKQRQLVTAYHKQTQQDYEAGQLAIQEQELAKQSEILESTRTSQQKMHNLLAGVTSYATPLVVLACALWAGLLAWSNVRERRTEIGLLRAIGKGSGSISALFLGKAVLLGLIGGLVGCLLGYGAAAFLGQSILQASAGAFQPSSTLLAVTLLGAPLLSAMASYLPTLVAVTQDPAIVLMEN